MPRTHPPTLLTLVRRTLRDECGLTPQDHLLVAVSGGGDSTALLDVLARLRKQLSFRLTAHGVDHGLRPEATSELAHARAVAEAFDVPFAVTCVTVAPGGNLQARARTERYQALRHAQASVGATLLATAHHADDRAETVLLRLLRGTGPRGLAVLPPRRGTLVRPQIRARRADVLAHLTRHHLTFADDPSNRQRRFLRVALREEVLPLLKALSPQIVEHLTTLADDLEPVASGSALEEVLGLSRAHRTQLQRLRSLRSGRGSVLLPGGREALIDPVSGEVVVRDRSGRGMPNG